MTDWTIAACIASGPSLNEEDCEQVRRAGIPTIVTNNTVQLCPWAQVLYAMDRAWWKEYTELHKDFAGRKCTAVNCEHAERIGFQHGKNSGHGAIALAAKFGARRIILLGYDCQYTDGKRHWFGDHKKGMANATKLPNWPAGFNRLALQLKKQGVEVINCTRETALTCFKREPLHHALARPLSLPAAPALPASSRQPAPCASP